MRFRIISLACPIKNDLNILIVHISNAKKGFLP